MNVDYEFYAGVYGGTRLTRTAFEALEPQAERRLAADTQNRSVTCTETELQLLVRLAICAVAEALEEQETMRKNGGAIAAESVGSWSRTYAAQNATAETRVAQAENLYLAPTGLLYRGVMQ